MRIAKIAVLTSMILAVLLAPSSITRGAVMAIGPSAFPPGSPVITFDGLAFGTEVNGLTVGGATFQTTLAGVPTNGLADIDGGPGVTNNVNPPNVVSFANPSGEALVVNLPAAESLFGFGYAIAASGTVPNAATINLFNGTTNVGSISFTGNSDPSFTGGFAGVQSTLPFKQAVLTFSQTGGAYAVDNVRFAPTGVPEPASLIMLSLGALGVFVTVLRQRRLRIVG
jgi:hypothetical protein